MADAEDNGSSLRAPRPCATCGVVFTPSRPGGKAKRAGTRWGVYCGRACQYEAQKKPAQPPKQKPVAECRVCGAAFTRRTAGHKTCSDACRAEVNRSSARVAFQLRYQASNPKTPRPCGECGEPFTPVYGTWRRRFCSDACMRRNVKRASKQMRRARKRGSDAEAVSALRVFERDGWRCHICTRKTPRAKRGTTHPRAPELDHIVPLANGGAHTYANTACACRECNGRKGATTYGQPSLLACVAA